jgi:hypothetical protein
MEIIGWVSDHWVDILLIAGAVCGLAAHIVALTPSPKDDAFVASIFKVVSALGGNYGNAKNAKPEATDKPEVKPEETK